MGVFAVLWKTLATLVGFVYPAYASYKALESKSPESSAQWLTYWVVFSLFTTIELFADQIIWWLPLYYIVKLVFVIWLQLPQTKGAYWVYSALVVPQLKRHQGRIDRVLEAGRQRVSSMPLGGVLFRDDGAKAIESSSGLSNRSVAASSNACKPSMTIAMDPHAAPHDLENPSMSADDKSS